MLLAANSILMITSLFQIAVFKIRILLSFMSLSVKSQVHRNRYNAISTCPEFIEINCCNDFQKHISKFGDLSGKYWSVNKLNICTLSIGCQFI